MTKIILVRHDGVDWILPERFHGRAEVPLTSQGIEAARTTSWSISATWRVTNSFRNLRYLVAN
jgi:bisphosphoglycerate-dependent phosphoglycerate mutase